MTLVVDASIALSWLLPDESNAEADKVLAIIEDGIAVTPSFFKAECANVLAISVRRKRIQAEDRKRALAFLLSLNLQFDDEALVNCWTHTVALAERFDLTVYDAMYLETARRNRLPLATLDNGLKRAAINCHVQLFGQNHP